jgi:hypothetical protein
MADDSGREVTYDLRLRLSDGSEIESGTFTTRRTREIGDLVNLPTGPNNQSEAGTGSVGHVP